jgi:hypothetical protein
MRWMYNKKSLVIFPFSSFYTKFLYLYPWHTQLIQDAGGGHTCFKISGPQFLTDLPSCKISGPLILPVFPSCKICGPLILAVLPLCKISGPLILADFPSCKN